jgi:crotonobetainyl-CoA:carnitine CoA-transferase CaiB-like acyl-CoA transferase
MPLPLSHIRVLDLSRVLAGPLCTQYLADMGAQVIKVEPPGKGDDTRHWGPPFAVPPKDGVPGIAAYFMCVNRGKQSVTIDLTKPDGQKLLRDLAAKSDVLIENFKVGGLKKYGLDYEAVRKINPRIVYCSITGFGQDGPYANRAGYDFVVQGMGGLMSITGQPDGEPGAAPMKVGVAISDEMSGMNALSGILAALIGREKTGEGTYLEVSLLETTIHALINQASNYLVTGEAPVRLGNAHPTIVPYSALPTKDGHIILAIGNDGQFRRFCEAAGIPHLADDPKFAINSQRIANRSELIGVINARLTQETSAYWIDLLESRAVPCGPIYRLDEMFADPHVIARGVKRETTEGRSAPLPVVANPVKMAGLDTTSAKAPPLLGEDTDAVLSTVLGLGDSEIARLRKAGAI